MKRLVCQLLGHNWTRVTEVGLRARPGGMLPLLDGYVAYKHDPNGAHLACVRCRFVDPVCYPTSDAERGSE